jgi:sulfonate transport system ATP-binding protein
VTTEAASGVGEDVIRSGVPPGQQRDAGTQERIGAESAIRVEGLTKTYGDGHSSVTALSDVSLRVEAGQFVCLLGASGCGKSTLLNLVAGLYRLDRGTIDTGNKRIGFVFQEPALFPWLTVARNVDAGMRFRGVARAERVRRVADLLEMVHLSDFADRRPHELSGGMQQRVSLARALAQDAEILLMDEPFGAIDAMTRSILHDELEQVWEEAGLTVLFVTHDVREAVRLADRVVVLSSRPGRVIHDHPVELSRPRPPDDAGVATLVASITDELRAEVRRHAR